MSDAPVKAVVDCSLGGAPDPAIAAKFEEAALALLRDGEIEKAGLLMQEAKEVLAASAIATVAMVALDADELKQLAADQAAHAELVATEDAAAADRQALADKLAAGKASPAEMQQALAQLLG